MMMASSDRLQPSPSPELSLPWFDVQVPAQHLCTRATSQEHAQRIVDEFLKSWLTFVPKEGGTAPHDHT